MRHFDIAILGAGVAGSLATYKLSTTTTKKLIVVDYGRPPMKRRRQLEGWLGCLPNSDGKLYSSDVDKVSVISGKEKAAKAFEEMNAILANVWSTKEVLDLLPQEHIVQSMTNHGYSVTPQPYSPMFPKDIHALSKFMAEKIEDNENVTYSFDNEITMISQGRKKFTITSENETFTATKILFSPGRSGWRFAHQMFQQLKLVKSNDTAHVGIKLEMNQDWFEEYNKSTCSLQKKNIDVGPFCWNGTVIPEDHNVAAISAFRANEPRWKSNKVLFDLMGHVQFPGKGVEQTDRLANLLFILTNERIAKEKVTSIMSGKSKLSVLKEFEFLKNALEDLNQVIPNLISKAYFHYPTILALPSTIELSSSFESKIPNFFVVGESANVSGLVSAGVSSLLACDSLGA